MQGMMQTERKLDLLDARVKLNMSINDLRIIVNSFKALEYQMQLDHEPYLDADGLSLKDRLEGTYKTSLARLGI